VIVSQTIDVKKVVQALGYRVHSENTANGTTHWWWTQTQDGQAGIVTADDYFSSENDAWSGAENDARAEYGPEIFDPYYVTCLVVEVLSDQPGIDDLSLSEIADEVELGESSGRIVSTVPFVLNASEAAFVLQQQGSSPSFMGLDVIASTPWSPPEVPAALIHEARKLASQILDARACGNFEAVDWALAARIATARAE